MCRAEAHQLFARKPIFDALGVQLVAVLLEDIDEEVWAFWPRYWAGMVVLDEKRDFFRALGGGKLMKDSLFTGFFLNPIARLNWKRAMKTGIQYNTRGEGTIKGGMFIVRRGKAGVAYQFAEKNFGDWAPLDEVLRVCHVIRVRSLHHLHIPLHILGAVTHIIGHVSMGLLFSITTFWEDKCAPIAQNVPVYTLRTPYCHTLSNITI
jgi:hypothetical protein